MNTIRTPLKLSWVTGLQCGQIHHQDYTTTTEVYNVMYYWYHSWYQLALIIYPFLYTCVLLMSFSSFLFQNSWSGLIQTIINIEVEHITLTSTKSGEHLLVIQSQGLATLLHQLPYKVGYEHAWGGRSTLALRDNYTQLVFIWGFFSRGGKCLVPEFKGGQIQIPH